MAIITRQLTDTVSASTASDIQLGSCVTEIGQGAFSGYTNITDVEFPDSLTTIGVGAFSGSSVSSIDFNNTETIGNSAFTSCQNITNLTIGSAVTSIGASAFQNCSGFTNLTIGSAVTSIGNSAFQSCGGLTNVDIPDNVETIGNNAFYYCRNMVSATIGDGVTSIGYGLFHQNDNMTGVTIGSGITSIGSGCFTGSKMKRLNIEATTPPSISYDTFGGSYLIYVPYEAYNDYISARRWSDIKNRIVYDDFPYKVMFMSSSGVENIAPCNSTSSITRNEVNNTITSGTTKLTFGDCITEIGQNAFSGNSTINEIEWSNSITKINSYAFYKCTGGIHMSSLPSGITYYDTSAFSDSSGNTIIDNLTIGSGVTNVGYYAFANTTIGNLRIGDFNTTTYNGAPFSGCNISSISFGNQITSTPSAMCYSCSGLTALTIPSNITNISPSSFASAKDLKTVVFEGNSPTTIEYGAFRNGSFSSVTIPNAASIGSEAFSWSTGLTNVSIGGSIPNGYDAYINTETIENYAFGYLTDGFESLELGSNVTSIGRSSFGANYNLKKLHILGNSGTVIGGDAFWNCSALTEVIIDNASSINGSQSTSYGSFGYSTNIERVTIGNVSSWDYAFYGRTKISSVTLSNGCTNVGQGTFSGCISLSNVDFPNTLRSIGASAFTNCSGMTTLIIPDSVISIGSSAFQNCSGLTSILVGRSTPPTIGTNVFNGSNCLIYVPQASYDLYVNAENWASYADRIYAVGQDYKALLMGRTSRVVNCNDNTTLALSEIGSNSAATINIGNCVTAIGDSAFTSSNSLETVVISSGVTSIGDRAFYQRSRLTRVDGGNNVSSIGNAAFYGCTSLTSFALPSGLTTIEGFAFCGSSITTIVVPSGVTSIEWGAFQTNTLTSVTFEGLTPPILVKYSQYSAPTNSYDSYYGLIRGKIPVYVPCAAYNDYLTAWASSDSAPITDCLVPYGQYEKDEEIVGEYLCDNGNKYKKMGHYVSSDNINWCLTGYINGDLIEADASDCQVYLHMELSSSCGHNCDKTGYTYTKYCGEATSTTVTEDDYPYRWRSDTANITYVTAVTIGNCATAIGNNAFDDCDNLQIVNISNSITSIGYSAFQRCTNLTSVAIGSGVTSIGDKAFRMCHLTALTIPSSVVSIGDEAFQTSANTLTSITINATIPPTIGTNVFSGSSCFIYVPCESVASYKNAWSMYADRIKGIQPCQEEIKVRANYSDGSNYTLTCGGSTILSSNSVPSASSVVSAVVGDCVTEIRQTFNFASSLSSITLGNSVTTLGSFAIRGTKITSITLPNTLTSIGESALENNSGLTSVVIPSGVTSIGTAAFAGCSSLTSIDIPSGVTSIGYNAFQGCTSLTSCTIGNGVTSIGGSAFYSCRSLKNITIGNSIASIGGSAFNYCNGLESITINATTPPSINYDTLYNTNNCAIYVPAESVDAYKAASTWSTYTDRIQAIQNS